VLPLVACAPFQPPDAIHEVALVALQLRVAALPLVRLIGFALSATTGAVAVPVVTVTVVVALLMPPAPVQDSAKLAVAVRAPVDFVPLVATVPLQAPEAVHEVALVEFQVMLEVPPEVMLAGEALSEIVGTAVALDPPPQAVRTGNASMLRPATAIRMKLTCRLELFIWT
jgi:hypothetical protein